MSVTKIKIDASYFEKSSQKKKLTNIDIEVLEKFKEALYLATKENLEETIYKVSQKQRW